MNGKPADEGTVFAKIARVSVWRQIIFVMHSSMSDDGLLESFKSVFLNSNELYTTKKLIYDSKNESIPSLLFRLNGILLSLQVNHVFRLSFLILGNLSYDLLENLSYDLSDSLRYDLLDDLRYDLLDDLSYDLICFECFGLLVKF